jgi:hypothetical protein
MLRAMSAPEPEPNLDPFAATPSLAVVKEAVDVLAARDWAGFKARFLGLDWQRRSYIGHGLDRGNGLEEYLRAVQAQDPGDVLPPTLLAGVLIDVGWDIRGGGRANQVSQEQFRMFHDYLRQAELLLVDVIAREPGMVLAWELRLITARGLSLGNSEARRRYDQLSRYDPHSLYAQRQMIQVMAPKWSGSLEKLHAFAKECSQGVPPGALNFSMVAEAHIEHWLDLSSPDDDVYMSSIPVRADLREAANASVFHPAFQRVPGWVTAVSAFAMAFSLAQDWAPAAACFRTLGPFGSEWPWQYLRGGPTTAIVQNRQKAYAAAGAAQ